ncbi:MAG TPA: DUF58 domain-containing protein [Acidimicrobiales bacterium]|nr:DUF58 domain-containing protein [Acidimicrobiales bacterium]
MLTRQGWLVAGGALALVAGGRILGVLELFIVGAATGLLVIVSLVSVYLSRLRLAVARHVTPPRVYAGTPSRVELSIRNDGERTTPVLRLFDPVSGTRGADLLLSPLDPDVVSRAAYRLPTERRGIVEIGPLEVIVADPFGLAASSTEGAPRTELTVYPRVEEIVPVPHTSGDDPHAGADHPSALGRSGEDFYALRPYVVGDDLRRVHWPSTARRDELTVRQDELPWQGRVTVLLDVRRNAHTPASLELAVSAAASIITASWKRRDLVRLITTDNIDFGFAAGTAHAEAIMEFLATVPASPGGTLRGVLDQLGLPGNGGAIVPIVAGIADAELAGLPRLRGRFAAVTVVHFLRSSYDPAAPIDNAGSMSTRGSTIIRVTKDRPFAEAWNGTLHRGRRIAVGAR